MPIITFLQDIFAATKGPYHRKVGRHTQTYCRRAVKNARNEMQKKLFFVSAICADELIAALLGVDDKREVAAFKERKLPKTVKAKQVTAAFRIYLSALLVLTSAHKDRILTGTGCNERELLHAWCSVFNYQNPDMQFFDEAVLPAYQGKGLAELSKITGRAILEQLFATEGELSQAERKTLENIMVEDAAAVVRHFAQKTEAL